MSALIAVTPNPARDVTITLDKLIPEATHRIDAARRVFGGKGVNVARVAASQGYAAFMAGPVRTSDHPQLADLGDPEFLHNALSDTPVPLRETFAIHTTANNETVIINERGQEHPARVWEDLAQQIRSIAEAQPGSVLSISGSWPPGTEADTLRLLIAAARKANISEVIVDCAGPLLLEACRLGAVVKPNVAELAETTGDKDLLNGARRLLAEGARMVVVSQGPDGVVLIDEDHHLHAKLPTPLRGNPTGAGDAMVAALACGFLDQLPAQDMLTRAVAWSAAAVLVDVAGAIDASWPELHEDVVLENRS